MFKQKKEALPGEMVVNLAQQLYELDSFFLSFKHNKRIQQFILENKEAVYSEISYRLLNDRKNENFGSFDSLLNQAVKYLKTKQIDNSENKSFLTKLRAINKKRSSVAKIIDVSRQHGTGWIPNEFKRGITFSLIALPTMFVVYESMRATVVASFLKSDLDQFTNFILGLYFAVGIVGYIQEQKTLKQQDALVFNPYSNLLALGLSTEMTSLVSRTPRHLFELSAIFSAITAKNEVGFEVLTPVLGAIIAAMIWSSTDIVFNFSQEKIQKRKNKSSVYNLGK